MFKYNSLMKKFTLYSLIAFVITGLVLGVLISNHIKNDMMQSLSNMPQDDLSIHLYALNKIIAIVIASGLIILYILLTRIVYSASKTLIQQNQALAKQNEVLEQSYNNTIITLTSVVDAKDAYTAGHSERVTKLAVAIGRKMGLGEKQLHDLELASLFHDIGKIGIPDNILLKPGMLSDDEFKKIKRHPLLGARILKNIDYLAAARPAILHHHERYDGDGYPNGIKGTAIPLGARIIAVADSYDAMISDRPYRSGMTHNKAVAEINKNKGSQFDPEIADVFLSVIESCTVDGSTAAEVLKSCDSGMLTVTDI